MRLLAQRRPRRQMSEAAWELVLEDWRGVPAVPFAYPAIGVSLLLDRPHRVPAEVAERYRAAGMSEAIVNAAASAHRHPRVPAPPAAQLIASGLMISPSFVRALEEGGAAADLVELARTRMGIGPGDPERLDIRG